jgi:hypothetical protein
MILLHASGASKRPRYIDRYNLQHEVTGAHIVSTGTYSQGRGAYTR